MGKKIWRSRTFRGTKREADKALAAFVTEQPWSQQAAPARTFGELLERWFEQGRATGRRRRRSRPDGL
jgi:succinate dehydrogenase flavin-adding protein (antitoxin of CptAB toxin-antitoxin module)